MRAPLPLQSHARRRGSKSFLTWTTREVDLPLFSLNSKYLLGRLLNPKLSGDSVQMRLRAILAASARRQKQGSLIADGQEMLLGRTPQTVRLRKTSQARSASRISAGASIET